MLPGLTTCLWLSPPLDLSTQSMRRSTGRVTGGSRSYAGAYGGAPRLSARFLEDDDGDAGFIDDADEDAGHMRRMDPADEVRMRIGMGTGMGMGMGMGMAVAEYAL